MILVPECLSANLTPGPHLYWCIGTPKQFKLMCLIDKIYFTVERADTARKSIPQPADKRVIVRLRVVFPPLNVDTMTPSLKNKASSDSATISCEPMLKSSAKNFHASKSPDHHFL